MCCIITHCYYSLHETLYEVEVLWDKLIGELEKVLDVPPPVAGSLAMLLFECSEPISEQMRLTILLCTIRKTGRWPWSHVSR